MRRRAVLLNTNYWGRKSAIAYWILYYGLSVELKYKLPGLFHSLYKNTSSNNWRQLGKSDQRQVSILLITTAKVDTAHNYDVMSAKFKSVETAITIRSVNQDFQINIMEPIQPQQRRVADQVFQQSLDQLEDILQEIETEEEEIPHLPQLHTTNLSEVEVDQDLIAIDLAALEDAVADIEQYLEEKTKTQEKL
ncbi:hypothetical protein [Nostoc sp. C110]|uniref:hypothetical protein n=1 Tax=Nostoc sp. C110 TaxID=3349876 RepID=UPI00370DDE52